MYVKRCFTMCKALTLLDFADASIWDFKRLLLLHAISQQELDGAYGSLMTDAN